MLRKNPNQIEGGNGIAGKEVGITVKTEEKRGKTPIIDKN